MPVTAHFQNLPAVVCRHLSEAQHRIQIAVCWFSHRDIFEVLLKKRRDGVSVELLLEYDNQNIHAQGLDFQKFIQLGGSLYAYRDTALMHHKFALMDDRGLLSGSFNWTYNSNAENLLTTSEPELVAAFREEFYRLKSLSVQIRKIRPAEVKVFAGFPLFQNTHFQLADLRRRISTGAGVWWIRAGRRPETWVAPLKEHRLPFDTAGLLQPYWIAYRCWDENLFDEMWPALSNGKKTGMVRPVRQLARRMQLGDVVLVIAKKNQVIALGVVQSVPKPVGEDQRHSTYREAQWLRILTEQPFILPKAVSPGTAGRFRGSAMQLVQGVYEVSG